jgi:hypothetical protein
MKQIFFLLLAASLFIACKRDPAYEKAVVVQNESNILYEGRTFEIILTSTEPTNVSYPQPLYCDCAVEKVENLKCVQWEKEPGGGPSYCIKYEGDGTYYSVMNCPTACGNVNVFSAIATLADTTGAIKLISKGLLIPENVDLASQYRDFTLPDGSIVRTVLVQVTKKKQLDQKANGEGETWLVLVERA